MLGLNTSGRGRKSLRARRVLYVGVLAMGVALSSTAARAGDATWLASPATNDFDTATNWNPNTAVPTGTASFATSNTTSLTFSTATTTIGGFTFNTGASNFAFTVGAANTLNFNVAGIAVNGTSTVTINNNNGLNFNNGSSAGGNTVTINNQNTDGILTFNNTSRRAAPPSTTT
jgi:hypothetical protein